MLWLVDPKRYNRFFKGNARVHQTAPDKKEVSPARTIYRKILTRVEKFVYGLGGHMTGHVSTDSVSVVTD